MEFIQIEVTRREALGSANANRIRRDGGVPAVLYGMQKPNLALTIARTEMERFLRTGSHLVELRMGERVRPAILRELQRAPATDEILHADFNRVDDTHEVETHVPVHWKGRAAGEGQGGVWQVVKDHVTVQARPRDLPREYLVDISHVELDEHVTIADLQAFPGVTLSDPHDTVLGHCTAPRPVVEAEPAAAEEAPAEGEAEPEGEAPASS